MTIEEQVLALADGLNQTLIILEGLAWDIQTRYGADLYNLRRDLLKQRDLVGKVIAEYDS